jgi:hypothetical protein
VAPQCSLSRKSYHVATKYRARPACVCCTEKRHSWKCENRVLETHFVSISTLCMIEKNEYFPCSVQKDDLTMFIPTTGVLLHDLIYFCIEILGICLKKNTVKCGRKYRNTKVLHPLRQHHVEETEKDSLVCKIIY